MTSTENDTKKMESMTKELKDFLPPYSFEAKEYVKYLQLKKTIAAHPDRELIKLIASVAKYQVLRAWGENCRDMLKKLSEEAGPGLVDPAALEEILLPDGSGTRAQAS